MLLPLAQIIARIWYFFKCNKSRVPHSECFSILLGTALADLFSLAHLFLQFLPQCFSYIEIMTLCWPTFQKLNIIIHKKPFSCMWYVASSIVILKTFSISILYSSLKFPFHHFSASLVRCSFDHFNHLF